MKLRANAKINLTLDICGVRADGYHIISSVMQSVSLCDFVEINKACDISVLCSNSTLCGENNIAQKAAKSFFEYTCVSGGAEIKIEKHIPCAAGLGGGSADAAAVIVGLDKLYATNLKTEELCQIALKVGADVPFCIVGGAAKVGGIGDEITPITPLENCAFVLLKQGQKLSTGDMYRKLDEKPYAPPKTESLVDAIKCGDITEVANYMGNAFSTVCDISKEKELLLKTKPLGICLSGSGPTVFAIYNDEKSAKSAANILGDNAYFALPSKFGVETE